VLAGSGLASVPISRHGYDASNPGLIFSTTAMRAVPFPAPEARPEPRSFVNAWV
jgi:hypothetical protein